MDLETKIVSREIIKPSSPTPKSLQKYQLSFLDQLAPSFSAPIAYFCESSYQIIPNSQKSKQLKKSLSETLSIFYPLAGRLINGLYVDCNDGGVPFVEAFANYDLSRVITSPDTGTMKKFFFQKVDESQGFCLAVQATYFRCGGLALGILISHKIADAQSVFLFGNTWSAVAKNSNVLPVPTPKFDAATYFPPLKLPDWLNPGDTNEEEEEVAAKVFTFPAEKIALLNEMYGGGGGVNLRPSRVEIVSAYIWTTKGMQPDPTKTYALHNLVNLRSRLDPPIPEYSFGNIIWVASSKLEAGDDGVEILRKMGEAKKAIYDGYEAEVRLMNLVSELMAGADKERHVSFTITSLSRLPLYEADFGWGKPLWVVVPGFPGKNFAILTDTKCGGGIQALVHLSKPDMEKFEAQFNLQLLKSNL